MAPEDGARMDGNNYLAITSVQKQNRLICEMGNSYMHETVIRKVMIQVQGSGPGDHKVSFPL